MSTINAGNIAKGIFIIFKGTPHYVTKTEFMSPGKGSPVMRVKMRNVKTAAATEFTYKSNEQVETAEVDKKDMSFLYNDGNEVVFMDQNTFEQASVPVSLMEDKVGFLTPNIKCAILWYEEKAIGISLPPNVALKVTEAPESIAGNRVNAPKKLVTLETGLQIQAPIFIRTGDTISVDTTSGEYLARLDYKGK
jgi:elongation factor P